MSESLKDEAARLANTSEDVAGNTLKVGDTVTITGKVKSIQPPDAQYGKDGIDLSNKNGMVEVALTGVITNDSVHVYSKSLTQVEANLKQPDPTPAAPPVSTPASAGVDSVSTPAPSPGVSASTDADAGVTTALGG